MVAAEADVRKDASDIVAAIGGCPSPVELETLADLIEALGAPAFPAAILALSRPNCAGAR